MMSYPQPHPYIFRKYHQHGYPRRLRRRRLLGMRSIQAVIGIMGYKGIDEGLLRGKHG